MFHWFMRFAEFEEFNESSSPLYVSSTLQSSSPQAIPSTSKVEVKVLCIWAFDLKERQSMNLCPWNPYQFCDAVVDKEKYPMLETNCWTWWMMQNAQMIVLSMMNDTKCTNDCRVVVSIANINGQSCVWLMQQLNAWMHTTSEQLLRNPFYIRIR